MSDVAELISTAKRLSGDDGIHAAGIFALKDQYLKLALWGTFGGVVGGDVGELVGSVAGNTGAAVGGSGGNAVGTVAAQNNERMHAAQQQGFDSYRLLIAVSDSQIHLLDQNFSALGVSQTAAQTGTTKLYYSIDRASVEVKIKKFGLSRRVYIKHLETGETLGLQGNVSPLSSVSNGDKTVLEALNA
ncbi:unannotated protein [freshwater metagenome]|uniref:Unannotated protein n=1 Tax=freshwater metagenome TaxID=449393 RepID=A0A6J5ZY77_9ZZZZ|nr:hypothetical protein [Actinomycetota bacterium]